MASALTSTSRVCDVPDYDEDFFEWTQRTAELLRAGRCDRADLEHVAEEIEDMGKRDRREVGSRLKVLLAHLLKWQAQPERREHSTWRDTIETQRAELELVLEDSPSLRRYASEALPKAYGSACVLAGRETRLPASAFAGECPFSIEQALDDDFWPD